MCDQRGQCGAGRLEKPPVRRSLHQAFTSATSATSRALSLLSLCLLRGQERAPKLGASGDCFRDDQAPCLHRLGGAGVDVATRRRDVRRRRPRQRRVPDCWTCLSKVRGACSRCQGVSSMHRPGRQSATNPTSCERRPARSGYELSLTRPSAGHCGDDPSDRKENRQRHTFYGWVRFSLIPCQRAVGPSAKGGRLTRSVLW